MAQPSLSEFADRINEVMPAIIKEFAQRQTNELYKGKITLPQFLILNYLMAKGDSKMKDLALFMQVTTAAMTGFIERLVRERYVKRQYDPQDRRIIRVTLTAKGSESVKKINLQRRNMIVDIFGQISQEERDDYLRILMHIRSILAEGKEAK